MCRDDGRVRYFAGSSTPPKASNADIAGKTCRYVHNITRFAVEAEKRYATGEVWKKIEKYMTLGKMLYLSHGFACEYRKITGVNPSKDVDVIMIAPKGSGTNVCRNFLNSAAYLHEDDEDWDGA